MIHIFAAHCGLYCGECDYREKTNCPGCIQSEGKMFWGECAVAKCCMVKGLDNCGYCDNFSCKLLTQFAYDRKQGDNGQRIRNLKTWKREGFEQWVKNRTETQA